jgi:hypothetical protein
LWQPGAALSGRLGGQHNELLALQFLQLELELQLQLKLQLQLQVAFKLILKYTKNIILLLQP